MAVFGLMSCQSFRFVIVSLRPDFIFSPYKTKITKKQTKTNNNNNNNNYRMSNHIDSFDRFMIYSPTMLRKCKCKKQKNKKQKQKQKKNNTHKKKNITVQYFIVFE